MRRKRIAAVLLTAALCIPQTSVRAEVPLENTEAFYDLAAVSAGEAEEADDTEVFEMEMPDEETAGISGETEEFFDNDVQEDAEETDNEAFENVQLFSDGGLETEITNIEEAGEVQSGDWGYSGKENLHWTFENGTLTISGAGAMIEASSYPWTGLSVNKAVIESGVTTIAERAFSEKDIVAVELPETLINIGTCAFVSCRNLNSINLPDSLQEIGGSAFTGCTSLDGIEIPSGITSISSGAFAGTGLTSIILPSNITTVENGAFNNCKSLETVEGFGQELVIDYNAFNSCTALKTAEFASVSKVNFNAFTSCPNLTHVTVPGVTFIGSRAFQDDTSLQSIVMGDRLTTIDGNAFSGCSSLQSIAIPETIESIGYMAFYKCSDLVSIGSLGKITIISGYAFGECENLKKIVIPEGVTEIGEDAFTSCHSLESVKIPDTVTKIYRYAFYGCNQFTSVTIPAGVTELGNCAFGSCENLRTVYIPETVVGIDGSAFFGCKNLTMYGKTGSPAYDCAKKNYYITFIDIDGAEISKCNINLVGSSHTYNNGNAVQPNVTVKYGTKTLVKGIDYTVEYKNNYKPGTATMIIKGKGSFSGTVTKTFTITKKPVSGLKVNFPKGTSYTYTGAAIKPAVTVLSGSYKLSSGNYSIKYKNNKNVGKASIVITGKGNYTGSVTKTFTITPKKTSISKMTAGRKQFTVKWKKQTKQVTGYQIQYSTNKKFTGSKTVTVKSYKTTSKKITKLKAKSKYYVRIRTYKTVGRTKYYSAWSAAKTVNTKK